MEPFIKDFEASGSGVDWSQYQTAHGCPERIPLLLRELVCGNQKKAIAATYELWNELCHQHAYVSSAAVPSYGVLVEVLKGADDDIVRELLDIMLGFAVCSGVAVAPDGSQDWVIEFRKKLIRDRAVFETFVAHEDEDIRYFSTSILQELDLLQTETNG